MGKVERVESGQIAKGDPVGDAGPDILHFEGGSTLWAVPDNFVVMTDEATRFYLQSVNLFELVIREIIKLGNALEVPSTDAARLLLCAMGKQQRNVTLALQKMSPRMTEPSR